MCDKPSRLSREQPLDFIARVAYPLKEAGVTIDTVTDGPQGWDDLAQIILLAVRQDKASGESRKLSHRVLAECARLAGTGKLLSSVPPYGYLIEYETVLREGRPRSSARCGTSWTSGGRTSSRGSLSAMPRAACRWTNSPRS